MKMKFFLALAVIAGVAVWGGCTGASAPADAEADAATDGPADGISAARTDYSLIPDEGLAVMERELSQREAQIVTGAANRVDTSGEDAELKSIRAERLALQEEIAKRQ